MWSTSQTPQESVAHAVSASCAIPLFFQPVDGRYVDGGALSNLPTFVFASGKTSDRPLASRVLAFTLIGEERLGEAPDNILAHLKEVASTIVEGSVHLQGAIQDGIHTVEISTGAVQATDFDKMDSATVSSLITAGKNATDKFFDEEAIHIKSATQSSRVCASLDEMYAAITENIDRPMGAVLFVDKETKWAYDLFPTLLEWRRRGIQLRMVLSKAVSNEIEEIYRRKLLRSMGADIKEVDALPYRGFVLDIDNPLTATALIRVESHAAHPSVEAVRYDGPLDATLIRAFKENIEVQIFGNWENASGDIKFEAGKADDLIKLLKGLPQYAIPAVQLNLEPVQIDAMIPLTEKVKEFKYKQVVYISEMYRRLDIPIFTVGSVIFGDGKRSFMTPPVVEATGSGFVVIEGTARMLFCKNEKIRSMMCVVARNVLAPLPAAACKLDRVRLVGRTLRPEQRYERFDFSNLRRVEYFVHNPATY